MATATAPAAPNLTVPFPVRRFTVAEYRRMGELGVLTEDDRVELLEGIITPKATHNPPHETAVELANNAIRERLSSGWRIRIKSSVTTDDSEPEPDVDVVRGAIRDFVARHPGPTDIGLLIEVAESSLDRDRNKRRIYARAGIVNYWIINLVDRQVEVYADPTGPADEPKFRDEQIYRSGKSVPLLIEGKRIAEIPVDDFLP